MSENYSCVCGADKGRCIDCAEDTVDRLTYKLAEAKADIDFWRNQFNKVDEAGSIVKEQLAEAKETIVRLWWEKSQCEEQLAEAKAALQKYEGAISIETVVLYDDWNSGILELALGDLLTRDYIGQPVTVWVKRREG